MPHGVLCHSSGFQGYTHMVNEMPVFVSLEYNTFHEIMLLMFLLTQVLLMFILWKSFQSSEMWNTSMNIGCRPKTSKTECVLFPPPGFFKPPNHSSP